MVEGEVNDFGIKEEMERIWVTTVLWKGLKGP